MASERILEEHLGYVADRTRRDLFEAAIRRVLKPGDQVVDLGCGSGILGLLCLQAGASRVIGIDASRAMIEVARQTFTRADLAPQVTFVHGCSHQVELPDPADRVDLVICDNVGYFGFDYGIVHTLGDVRRRFLSAGGTLIPRRLRLQLAVVESDKCHQRAEGWRGEHVPAELHWLRDHGVNAKYDADLTNDELLGSAALLGEIDLGADNPDFFSWSVDLKIERDGVIHGLAGWFEAELAEDVWMTNSPLADHAISRPQAFLPIDEAVKLRAGDLVHVTIMTRPRDNVLAWIVDLPGSRRFSHSTWQGMLLAPEDLIRAQPDRQPQLSQRGKARGIVLAYCDGQRSVRQIEQEVLQDHPNLFPSRDEITRFVARVLGRDTE